MALQLPLIDTRQAAQLLSMAPVTLRQWRMWGTGPRYVKIGRTVRYSKADIEAFAASRANDQLIGATKPERRSEERSEGWSEERSEGLSVPEHV